MKKYENTENRKFELTLKSIFANKKNLYKQT